MARARQVAFIGIGQMGEGMARRLQAKGFDVMGYDISEQSRKVAEANGIATTDDLGRALAGRPLVLSSVPNSKIALDVWLGAGGIAGRAEKGALCLELSTIDPQTMREIAAGAEAKGLRMIDAPVSGGPNECVNGTLVIMVGGKQIDIADAEDVLQALSSSHPYVGDIGNGKTVKLVNNMMSMGNLIVAAEAFALGTAAGMDPQLLLDVLSQSGGRSNQFLKHFPRVVAGDFSPGFKLELGEKDLALAVELGRSLQQPTPAASAIRELMALGLASGYRGKNVAAMLDLYNNMRPPLQATEDSRAA